MGNKMEKAGKNNMMVIDLQRLFCYFLDHMKFIVLVVILGGVIACGISIYLIDPIYSSTAEVYVVSSDDTEQQYLDKTDLDYGDDLTSDYEKIIVGRTMLEKVAEKMDTGINYAEIRSMLKVSHEANTRIISVTATNADAAMAGTVANAVVDVAVEYIPDTIDTVYPVIIERAAEIGSISGPAKKKNTVLGAMAGLMLAIIVLTILFIKNDTVSNEEDMEKMFGIRVLATFPDDKMFEKEF